MKSLRSLLTEYLCMRRSQGFKLHREEWHLSSFVSFLDVKRQPHVTTTLALEWAKQPIDAHPGYWASKLSVIRGFARHLYVLNSRHEIPPTDLLPHVVRRTTPAIYKPNEVLRLLRAAKEMHPRSVTASFRNATYETLFGLLASTGIRVGEAIRLDDTDVDWRNHVLCIRESKFRKSREVPIQRTVLCALRRYRQERDRQHARRHSQSFFVSLRGTRLIYNNVHGTFRQLLHLAGIKQRRARVHDLRHTFVVQTILRWHREGANVDAKMPSLSTYLGHRSPSSTYWYLTATPELMSLVGRKLGRALGTLP